MKIVKGDTVYLRSGKDVAGRSASRLQKALGKEHDEEGFRKMIESMPMNERIAKANEDKGVRGKVTRVLNDAGKVVVEGLNMVTKHQKPRATGGAAQLQQGGRIKMEAAIPVSRVMLICPHCDKPTRVGMQLRSDERRTLRGNKTVQVRDRVCKQCGEVILRPTEKIR